MKDECHVLGGLKETPFFISFGRQKSVNLPHKIKLSQRIIDSDVNSKFLEEIMTSDRQIFLKQDTKTLFIKEKNDKPEHSKVPSDCWCSSAIEHYSSMCKSLASSPAIQTQGLQYKKTSRSMHP